MPLVPYEPLRHLDNMRRDLERFFTSGFPSAHAFGLGQGFDFPRVDVHETGNEIVAACDIPGLEKKDDVDIDIENNILTISGTVRGSRNKRGQDAPAGAFCGPLPAFRDTARPARVRGHQGCLPEWGIGNPHAQADN